MANSADPDQMASSEANWSGSILFAKAGLYSGSAGQGFNVECVIVTSAIVGLEIGDKFLAQN